MVIALSIGLNGLRNCFAAPKIQRKGERDDNRAVGTPPQQISLRKGHRACGCNWPYTSTLYRPRLAERSQGAQSPTAKGTSQTPLGREWLDAGGWLLTRMFRSRSGIRDVEPIFVCTLTWFSSTRVFLLYCDCFFFRFERREGAAYADCC